jgi:hypothetical protein
MSAPILEVTAFDGSTRKFSLGKMPARAAFNVRVRLVKMVGEPIFRLLAGAGGKPAGVLAAAPEGDATAAVGGLAESLFADTESVGKILGILGDRLDPVELGAVMDVVFEACRCDGKRMHGDLTDAAFAGVPPGAMEKVLFAALKENFGNFFGAAT